MQYEANRIAVFDLHQLCCSHADLPYRTGDDPVATSQTIFSVETPHFSNLILINVDFATAYLLTGGRTFRFIEGTVRCRINRFYSALQPARRSSAAQLNLPMRCG